MACHVIRNFHSHSSVFFIGTLLYLSQLMDSSITSILYSMPESLPSHPTCRSTLLLAQCAWDGLCAVAALSRIGMIHCDIKPAHLMMSLRDLRFKLGDFGQAMLLDGRVGPSRRVQERLDCCALVISYAVCLPVQFLVHVFVTCLSDLLHLDLFDFISMLPIHDHCEPFSLHQFHLSRSAPMSILQDKIHIKHKIGTHGYTAPEIEDGIVSPRSDWFSLGTSILEIIPQLPCPAWGCRRTHCSRITQLIYHNSVAMAEPDPDQRMHPLEALKRMHALIIELGLAAHIARPFNQDLQMVSPDSLPSYSLSSSPEVTYVSLPPPLVSSSAYSHDVQRVVDAALLYAATTVSTSCQYPGHGVLFFVTDCDSVFVGWAGKA